MSSDKPNKPPSDPKRYKRDSMVDKAVRESVKAREREEKMRELRAIFSNYGHQVMTHVTSQFIRYGHIKNTLKILGLNQPAEFGAQRDLLLRHLDQSGSRGLIQKLTSQATPSQAADIAQELAQQNQAEQHDEVADQILDEAESRLMSRVLKSRPGKERENIHDKDTHVKHRQASDSTATDPNSPRRRSTAPGGESICETTGRPMKDGVYVERRSGEERRKTPKRRTKKDRRGSVEIIYQNKRFGGSRRSGGDRRSGRDRRSNP